MSNIGMPNISQQVLRGCVSSVYSMPMAQPLPRQYSACLRICSSLRSGRKENVPCVSRMEGSDEVARKDSLRHSCHRRGGHEVGGVGRRVAEAHVAPAIERGLQRLAR